MNTVKKANARILERLSLFLNLMPDAIDKNQLYTLCEKSASTEKIEYAYGTLISAYCGLNDDNNEIDRDIFRNCFTKMAHLLNPDDYKQDLYYKNIKFPNLQDGDWTFKLMSFKPYEAFLTDETLLLQNGSIMPQIGFFEEEFFFPAVLQNGREWMTVTPHEINSTKQAAKECYGDVLTYGLGLGYFTYLASMKDNVKSITVAELDKTVINMFQKHILPQFPYKDKIKIVHTDAFEFAKNNTMDGQFDYIFADTWHDPSDGVEMYKRFKALEAKNSKTKYAYWIEKTLNYYMTLTSTEDFSNYAAADNIFTVQLQ